MASLHYFISLLFPYLKKNTALFYFSVQGTVQQGLYPSFLCFYIFIMPEKKFSLIIKASSHSWGVLYLFLVLALVIYSFRDSSSFLQFLPPVQHAQIISILNVNPSFPAFKSLSSSGQSSSFTNFSIF